MLETNMGAVEEIDDRLFLALCRAASTHWSDLPQEFQQRLFEEATGLQRLGVRLEVTEAVLNHISGSRAGVAGVYQRHALHHGGARPNDRARSSRRRPRAESAPAHAAARLWLRPCQQWRRNSRDQGHRSITSAAVYTALAPNRFKDFWQT
jgi:hypothetical protein